MERTVQPIAAGTDPQRTVALPDPTAAARWGGGILAGAMLLAALATLFGWIDIRIREGHVPPSSAVRRLDPGRQATPADAWIPGVIGILALVGASWTVRRRLDGARRLVIVERWFGWGLRAGYRRREEALGGEPVVALVQRRRRGAPVTWLAVVQGGRATINLLPRAAADRTQAEAAARRAALALGLSSVQVPQTAADPA